MVRVFRERVTVVPSDEESFQEEILETDSVVSFDHYCLHACMEVLA